MRGRDGAVGDKRRSGRDKSEADGRAEQVLKFDLHRTCAFAAPAKRELKAFCP
jgi:hypothetical protein